MSPLIKRILITLLAGMLSAPACGPLFQDRVLDLPQAALRVRAVCLLDEVIAIDHTHGRGLSQRPAGRDMIRRLYSDRTRDWRVSYQEMLRQQMIEQLAPAIAAGMPAELAEGTPFGEGATRVEAVELAVILLENGASPARAAEIVTAFTGWRDVLPEVDLDGRWDLAVPPAAEVPAPPDFPEVPRDIVAYWAAARAWRGGDAPAARTAWQAILDMPADEHSHRAVWAAWMLGKTSPDAAVAVPFYQEAVRLGDEGHRDALGLVSLAMGWLATTEEDPVARLKWYFEAACSGNEDMLISLRRQLPAIFTDESAMARAAADPLAREIVTALHFAMYHDATPPGASGIEGKDGWLAMLDAHPAETPSPAAAKAAWICYGRAEFDAARGWLALAPPDAGEVLWLRAKLALRDGRLDEAARLFARAAPHYQVADGEQLATPYYHELRWFEHGRRHDWMRGQFHSDRAIIHIGRGEFLRAMDFLVKASYHDDAAYLAERVLTTDELVGWVKRHRPVPPVEDAEVLVFRIDADGRPWAPHRSGLAADPMRYLLARRLAREFRFREAAEFMPPALSSVFDHYVRLHREARNGSWEDETKAVILWHLALIRRHLGMEIFGYEGAPDNADWGGAFPGTDFMRRRTLRTGWQVGWNDGVLEIAAPTETEHIAVPAVSRDEVRRLAPHAAAGELRFHYRYTAADIAWRAAGLLPDNDPRTLFVLHQAGSWLAPRDPQAAERFYLAMIRRCRELPEWPELDRRRWFLPEPPENPLPALPAELRFSRQNTAHAGGG